MYEFVLSIVLAHLLKDAAVICADFGHQFNVKKKTSELMTNLAQGFIECPDH